MYYKIEQLKNILANHKNCVFSLDHLCSSALEYIQHLESGIDRCYELAKQLESAQPKWISVEERKPKVGKFVLFQYAKNAQNPTMHARNTMAVGRYEYGMFLVEGCSVKVTHWMPLPEPPKEET